MILLVSPARAGCNPSDIASAAKESASAVSDCASACADGVGCDAAALLTSVLTGLAADASQDVVNSFCNQAQGDATKIVSELNSVGGSSIGQNVLGEVASALEGVGAVGKVVQCACEAEQGGNSLGSDLGDCAEDLLCWAQQEAGLGACDCTPPSPALANCAATNSQCDSFETLDTPACQFNSAPFPIYSTGPNGTNAWNYWPQGEYTIVQSTTQEGTYVATQPPTDAPCSTSQYCFCPSPMKPNWTKVPQASGDSSYIFSCDCPDGTHPGALTPTGISSCYCDNTNQPPILTGLAINGICPPPACPAGQTRLGGVGDCVTPCSDPSQGMAFDGSCCNPAQMTSCGECCPPSTVPDPKSGTCEPRPQQPK